MQIVSGVLDSPNWQLAATGAVDYGIALEGLSLKQAQLLLATVGMDEEQQRELLLRTGLIVTSNEMSAKLVAEALSTDAITAAHNREILTELGLMEKRGGWLILTNKCGVKGTVLLTTFSGR